MLLFDFHFASPVPEGEDLTYAVERITKKMCLE